MAAKLIAPPNAPVLPEAPEDFWKEGSDTPQIGDALAAKLGGYLTTAGNTLATAWVDNLEEQYNRQQELDKRAAGMTIQEQLNDPILRQAGITRAQWMRRKWNTA